MGRFIQIVELGPRDGLQNEKAVLEPAVRADLVRRLGGAGASRFRIVDGEPTHPILSSVA